MKLAAIPRPLLLVGVWLVMLAIALVFLFIIENAIVTNLPWFGAGN